MYIYMYMYTVNTCESNKGKKAFSNLLDSGIAIADRGSNAGFTVMPHTCVCMYVCFSLPE